MQLRLVLAASFMWAGTALSAHAAGFYEMNRTPSAVDLIDSDVQAPGPDQIRTVNVGRASWDNKVDVSIYQVDCTGQRIKLMSVSHFENMTNGLHPNAPDQPGGDWMARNKAKTAKHYVDFVCGLPDSAKHYIKADGDTLAAAARRIAIDLGAQQARMFGGGDDTANAMMGSY